ncbi:MAG: hypothetical protein JSW73_00255 [Candidatus Woesearchaeota archaeon]|nr:MAG: hypothetical protein JSW73_00255 [Candidatus Woesearchaeota archaeon]
MEAKIIEEKPLLSSEVEKSLGKIKKKDRLPIQEVTYDFNRKFKKIDTDKSKKLIEEINALEIPRVTDFHICQIANLMPKNLGELRSIFAGTKTTITPENIKSMLEIIKKYDE